MWAALVLLWAICEVVVQWPLPLWLWHSSFITQLGLSQAKKMKTAPSMGTDFLVVVVSGSQSVCMVYGLPVNNCSSKVYRKGKKKKIPRNQCTMHLEPSCSHFPALPHHELLLSPCWSVVVATSSCCPWCWCGSWFCSVHIQQVFCKQLLVSK